MAQCKLCNHESIYISKEIAVCLKCVREKPESALSIARDAHLRSRNAFGLPIEPPRDPAGLQCNICINQCRISDEKIGYCGLRKNQGGTLTGVSPEEGRLSWYHDSLPTNCVGDWVCPGGTGAGFPKYAYSKGSEFGYFNLAVFFRACTFNCLYCQNWQFRNETHKPHKASIQKLISDIDEWTSCICYFGGDPTPQIPFAIKASKIAIEQNKGRILRICWETNGSMHKGFLDEMLELSLNSGGCIKFDLKAWDDNLHKVLTGVSKQWTFENFYRAGQKIKLRQTPPLLIASTLIVPGYIDEEEISGIAGFIASIDPEIPYSLLAFYPHFYMTDMPFTTKNLAWSCLKAAQKEGLKRVIMGNVHLLR